MKTTINWLGTIRNKMTDFYKRAYNTNHQKKESEYRQIFNRTVDKKKTYNIQKQLSKKKVPLSFAPGGLQQRQGRAWEMRATSKVSAGTRHRRHPRVAAGTTLTPRAAQAPPTSPISARTRLQMRQNLHFGATKSNTPSLIRKRTCV